MINPYWFQQESIEALFEYFTNKKGRCPLIGLPTGTGKSVVIAWFIYLVLRSWPSQRVLMLTHVKELISQNAKRLLEVWPQAPVGIYSSGLNKRDIAQPIIYGGIQSLYKRIGILGRRDVLIIDEAHLLSPEEDAMYAVAIKALRILNPDLIIIGLSATLFRMGMGELTNGDIFDGVAYDMTDMKGFNRLIVEGFLAPLYPKKTHTEYDTRGLGLTGGEFNKKQLEESVDKLDLTVKVLDELVYFGQDRHKWLVFASGVNHAEHISELLNTRYKIPSVAIHSKVGASVRAERLKGYENDTYRCAVNNNVLTVGYDHPPINYIGMMRSTMSPGLWVQMAGRGTRISRPTGKTDTLLMDFAGNARRLGPINDPKKPNPKGKGGGDAPVRICEACGIYNHASARECFACGHIFTFKEKLYQTAQTDEIIRTDEPVIESFEVHRVLYARYVSKKDGAKPCVRVTYICGIKPFAEYIHFDQPGKLGHEARDWFRLRMPFEPPTPVTCTPYETATDAALTCTSQFRRPRIIRVHTNTQYPSIQSVEF